MEEPSQWPVIIVGVSAAVHFGAAIANHPGVALAALAGVAFGAGGLWFAG